MKNKKNSYTWLMELYFFLLENGKGLMISILFLSAMIVLFFVINNLRDWRASALPCESKCEITDIQANKAIDQGLDGNKVITSSYSVEFIYKINEKIYRNKNTINVGFPINKLTKSFQNYTNMNYIVKYDCNNPQNSFISIK